MKCPVEGCGLKSKVVETRKGFLRNRLCPAGHRFFTNEVVIEVRSPIHHALDPGVTFVNFRFSPPASE